MPWAEQARSDQPPGPPSNEPTASAPVSGHKTILSSQSLGRALDEDTATSSSGMSGAMGNLLGSQLAVVQAFAPATRKSGLGALGDVDPLCFDEVVDPSRL